MKYKKSLIIIILAIFLVSIASVCASDVNDTLVTSEDNTEIELSQCDETDEISVTDDSPVIGQSKNEEKLTAGNIWYVNSSAANGGGTSENPFNNLKDTLDASGDDDIIRIASGTYAGENNTRLIIDRNLTIERYGDGDVIFDGGNTYGIWEIQAKSINITGLTFQNGYGGNGGALSFKSQLFNSNINADFNNNQAMSSGGAIHFSEALTNVNITGNFTKNNAHGYSYDGEGGGAICFLGQLNRVNIIGDFTDNIAQSFAGANYFKSNIANVNIYGNYKNNSAIEQNGGANWFMALENVAITGNFTNNIALGFGGANVFYEELKNVNITGNYINNTANWNNGGANQFKEKLTNVAITGDYSFNKAKQNGGANWFGDSKALDNVNITGNYDHNEAGQDGGANRLGKPVNVNIIGNYTGNSAKNTGSWQGGGAIYVQNDPTKLTISGNFYNNTAVSQGAVVCFYNSMNNVNMTGNFINNTGKSVIYNYGVSNSIIHDSIFLNNSRINCDGPGTLKIVDTWFGNNATNYNIAPGENKIDFDNWLFLNATVDSNIDDASKISNIVFKLFSYNASGVSEYNNNLLNPINLTITATNGNVSKNIAELGKSIQFTPTKGGTATVTATVENACQTVEIPVKGDFDLLQDLVNNESLSIINLERNYTYNEFDSITEGVRITRTITINGNGYTIDAKGKSRIFYIEADNVVIENLTLKNANFNGDGGAVYFAKSGWAINCNFTDNQASYYGGAVYFLDNGNVTNCNFVNNTASDHGGAIRMYSGTVTNCNFTDNYATYQGGAIRFSSTGTVTNCNFTNNQATDNGGAIYFAENSNGNVINCNFSNNKAGRYGGAVHFSDMGDVTKCNFINNSARYGGAIWFTGDGNVTNCNFTKNNAYYAGAVHFNGDGDVTKCNFTNNSAIYSGAISFNINGNVTNCSFTGNNATTGSAIYYDGWVSSDTLTISNSTFLNNRANVDEDTPLNVTINENNITITFMGQNNLINAIYSKYLKVTFNNVTYWGANGITTISSTKSGSNKEAGQNLTIAVVVNDKLVLNDVKVTDENGTIVLDISAGENYYISARHDEDSYYTAAEKTISNMKFYVNVTETETTNKTVNITAKSNIPNDIIEGKLLFILPNKVEINATYATNGTWWAEYTFADYGDYQVNASYIGLDNVTVTNATISIVKANSTVNVSDLVLTYGESKEVTVTTTGATGVTAKIDDTPVDVIDNFTIPISGLNAGNYTLTVTTIPDDDHISVNKTVNITVNKADTKITLTNETLYLKAGDIVSDLANLTPADAGNLTFQSSDEEIAIADDDTIWARVKGNVTVTVSFAGTDNYNASENRTITVYVTPKDASVSVENDTLDLNVDEKYEFNPTVNPRFLTVYYSSSNESVAVVTEYGLVRAVGEGTAIITLTVGNDQTYAINTTNVTVIVSKVPTEISIANETLYLKAGDMVSGLANLTPADAGNLTFQSSDEDVALVYDGTILARVKGNVTVTVSFAGTDKYAAAENRTITVYVEPKDASVSVENDTLDLNVDEKYEFNPTVSPRFLAVEYSSSNESVAVVTEYGLLRAVGEGTAVITLTVGNGQTYAINTTNVTVTVSRVPTEISLVNETADLKVLDEISSGATLTPADAGNLTYSSGNESVAIVKDGKIIAVGAGQTIITVSFNGTDKYAAAESKIVAVTVSLRDAGVSVNNSTLDLFVDDNFTVVATTSPEGLNVHFVPDDSGVYSVDDDGVVTALKEGTGSILVKVGGDGVYAENSTAVNVTVSKVPTEITVASPAGELPVGAMGHVAAELNPSEAGKLSYASNDTNVVSVSSTGVLKANGAGTALITVSFNGTDKYAACESKNITITVNLKDATVNVNNSTLDLFVGDNFTVVATTSPEGLDVTFVPDDSGVVGVDDNGVVAALKEGTASILVKVGGDGVYAENSTAVAVTVSKVPTEIVVSSPVGELSVGAMGHVAAELNPSEAGKLSYASNDTSVVSVSSTGVIKANNAGTALITVSFNGTDKYAACESKNITITVNLKDATVNVNNSTLDLFVGDNFTVVATTSPEGLNVTFVPDDSGVYSVDDDGVVTALKEGTGSILVKVGGDGVYAENSTAVTVTVSKVPTEITVASPAGELSVGAMGHVAAELVPSEAGKLSYASNDTSVVSVSSTGVIKANGAGTALITVSFNGTDKYAACESKNITITVNLKDATVNVNNSTLNLFVGDNFTVVATTSPEGLDVTFVPDDSGVYSVDDDGVVTALKEGTGSILVKVGGDGVYAENSTIVAVSVSKIPTEIVVSSPTGEMSVGAMGHVAAELNPCEAGNLTYDSNDSSVVSVSSTGVLKANNAGTALITVSFNGTDKYAACESKNITVTVNLKDAGVSVNNSTLNLFVDDTFAVVAATSPEGLNVTFVPDDSGVYSVDDDGVVTALKEGTGSILVKVGGDGVYAENSTAVTVTVSKVPTEIEASSVSTVYNGGDNLTVTLNDAFGKPVGGADITVDLNGVKTYTTDGNGRVNVSTDGLAAENYTARITFAGNDRYKQSAGDVNVTVNKAASKITAKSKTFKTTKKVKKYAIILKDNEGNAIGKAKVTLKVNGKKYRAVTDSSGKAVFKLKLTKKGKYKAKIKFKGDENYTKAAKKVKIRVKSGFKTVAKGSKRTTTVKKIQRALKHNGYYLSYNGHYLKVDGIFDVYTEWAVREFQTDKNLKVTGKVDEKTAKKLKII